MFAAMPVISEYFGGNGHFLRCATLRNIFFERFFCFFEKILGRQNITYYLCAQLRIRQKTL